MNLGIDSILSTYFIFYDIIQNKYIMFGGWF